MERPADVNALRGWIEKCDRVPAQRCRSGYVSFLDDEPIAWTSARIADRQRCTQQLAELIRTLELELTVGERFRGFGYSGEIARGIFRAHNDPRIAQEIATIDRENKSSARAAVKGGLRRTGDIQYVLPGASPLDVQRYLALGTFADRGGRTREGWYWWHDRPMPPRQNWEDDLDAELKKDWDEPA
jgi:hypothetical protein